MGRLPLRTDTGGPSCYDLVAMGRANVCRFGRPLLIERAYGEVQLTISWHVIVFMK